jgi:hypothetical protein
MYARFIALGGDGGEPPGLGVLGDDGGVRYGEWWWVSSQLHAWWMVDGGNWYSGSTLNGTPCAGPLGGPIYWKVPTTTHTHC